MASSGYDYLFKIVLIGDAGVGKSSILLRLADDSFHSAYITTIGVDFRAMTLEVEGKVVKLQVWDTAGQERFRTVTSAYYRGAHGIIVVYDISNRDSFRNVGFWMDEIDRNTASDVSKFLFANKCDSASERDVSHEEGQTLADSHSIPYMEVSAKDSTNITQAFILAASDILDKISPGPRLAVTLSGVRKGPGALISCVSMAGAEMATVEIENIDEMTWAKLRPLLTSALAGTKRRLQFVSSAGSLISVADGAKAVVELLDLSLQSSKELQHKFDRVAEVFGRHRLGHEGELRCEQLREILEAVTAQPHTEVTRSNMKDLLNKFLTETRREASSSVQAMDFLSWLFEAPRS